MGTQSLPVDVNDLAQTQSSAEEPERRFVNDRWLCKGIDGVFLEYVENEWRTVEEADGEDLNLDWEKADASTSAISSSSNACNNISTTAGPAPRCVVDGVEMVWNEASQQWLPDVDVNEDFLASYHANYGVAYDYSQMTVNGANGGEKAAEKEKPLTKEERKAKKRELEEKESAQGWVDIGEEKNTNVYVSGLPSTITEDEFFEFMSKCGVIMKDPRNNKPKVKLYRTEDGEPKGDGTCCYVKRESVELALQILDGWELNKHRVSVERAHFELKGNFDPSKKKRKLTAAQKKRFFESQQKLFEWKPDKPRNYRPVSDCTVVFKNLFALDEIDADTSRIMDLKSEMETACERFGTVKKVVVYDSNPEGIVTVAFDNVEASDQAVQILNGSLVSGKLVSASLWDGKTKFRREETDEERQRRDEAWQKFLLGEQEQKENGENSSSNTQKEEREKSCDNSEPAKISNADHVSEPVQPEEEEERITETIDGELKKLEEEK